MIFYSAVTFKDEGAEGTTDSKSLIYVIEVHNNWKPEVEEWKASCMFFLKEEG